MLNTRIYGRVPVVIPWTGDPEEGIDGSGDAEIGTPVSGGEPDKQTHVEKHQVRETADEHFSEHSIPPTSQNIANV